MAALAMTCINCPMGCALSVEVENGEAAKVAGNQCARGVAYAKAEVANPVRMMTSTVRLRGGAVAQLPVKTRTPIPKGRVAESVRALAGVELDAPAAQGQVVLRNVCGTGVDVISTRSVPRVGG